MGKVIAFELGAARRAGIPQQEPASVLILPVVLIERDADQWQGLPSDSAPPFIAPDIDNA
jgi:hypothetical protein